MLKRLAVGLVLLAAAYALFRWAGHRQASDSRAERSEAQLLKFDERDLRSLTITIGGVIWRFDRLADGWRMTAPIRDAVRSDTLEAFVGALRKSPVDRVITDPESLSSYGLDPPRATVRIEAGTAQVLHLGDPDPTRQGIFAQVEGRDGVLVVKLPEAIPLMNPNPQILRDNSFTALRRTEVTAVEIGRGDRRMRLARGPTGWWIESPMKFPASDSQVDRFLDGLEAVRIVGFDDGADASNPRLRLGSDALSVVLEAAGAKRAFRIGAASESGPRYASRDDRQTVLEVDASSLASVPEEPKAFAETKLTKVNRYHVVRFAYAGGGRRYAASRVDDATWRFEAGATVDAQTIYSLLVRLLEAPTSGWEQGRPTGASAATLEFEAGDGHVDRIDYFAGRRAAIASLPDVVFVLSGEPPAIP